MGKRRLNYCKCGVVCHGKSELIFVQHIQTSLHLNIALISRDKGRSSIQINGLKNYLRKLRSLKSVSEEYGIEYKKNKLANFKLFVIMDTDDCTAKDKTDFMNRNMFKDHAMYEYIVPIFNSPNLDDVLLKAGLIKGKIKSNEKEKVYTKEFPIIKEPVSYIEPNEIEKICQMLVSVSGTNMEHFIEYCLEIFKQSQQS